MQDVYYSNSEFESLELNSETFYSNNLKLFLDSYRAGNENILMLSYGKNWELNIVSNTLEKTNLFLSKNTDEDIDYTQFSNYIEISKLSDIKFPFYKMDIVDGNVYRSEIQKFYTSLQDYTSCCGSQCEEADSEQSSILIHNNNIIDITLFPHRLRFETNDDIDTYISTKIIPELASTAFEKIFIKDNLSSNYLELYGLRVAYHIRLSQSLGEKRFVPIVMISEYDSDMLIRFTQDANILFTDGIYLCKNSKEEIEHFKSLHLKGLEPNDYEKFLNTIAIEMPKDTTGSHGIANKWSIYRWSECLHVKSESVIQNNTEIENKLYFKYLKARYFRKNDLHEEVKKPSKKGKVLLIDDEWSKGWGDLFKNVLTTDTVQLAVLEYDYKDKKYTFIKRAIENKIKEFDPDVVILDLRLAQNDHENDDIENYTGIKILQRIHEINAGIQVIMFTATSKSTILEKLYEKKILGYIKKEHPSDVSLDTEKNIDKLVTLVDKGLGKKYLKEIYNNKIKILNLLKDDIFARYGIDFNKYELYWKKIIVEVEAVFDILDSDRGNRFLYATVSIAVSIESILSIFIPNDRQMFFWDEEAYECQHNALRCRIQKLFKKLANENFDMQVMIDKRNDYIHKKPVVVNQEEIKTWFNKLRRMIEIIQNPPKLKHYDKKM